MATPTHSVLETPELLEAVLLKLDMRTLLTSAQRVSRRWCSLITDSPAIQRKLYFQPLQTRSPISSPITNPLLAEVFTPWFAPFPCTSSHASFAKSPSLCNRLDAILRHNASWKCMLVTQPPATTLGFWTHYHAMCGDGDDTSVEECPGGLRMERLYHLGQDYVVRGSGFRMLWNPKAGLEFEKQPKYGRRETTAEARREIEELAGGVDVLMARTETVSCVDYISHRVLEFALRYSLDPEKWAGYLEWYVKGKELEELKAVYLRRTGKE